MEAERVTKDGSPASSTPSGSKPRKKKGEPSDERLKELNKLARMTTECCMLALDPKTLDAADIKAKELVAYAGTLKGMKWLMANEDKAEWIAIGAGAVVLAYVNVLRFLHARRSANDANDPNRPAGTRKDDDPKKDNPEFSDGRIST